MTYQIGEEVEVKSCDGGTWKRALYIGRSHCNDNTTHPHIANVFKKREYTNDVSLYHADNYKQCRKLTKPRETITIGGVAYYKDDVEAVTKDLKPIRESK